MEEMLIEKVRAHDSLYNVRSQNYRDQHIRQEAWQEIGQELNITGEAAKNHWDKLRRCYLNARNRRRRKKSGEAAKSIPPWKFEAQMSFLSPFLDSRQTQTNITDNENLIDDVQISDEVDNNTQGNLEDDNVVLQQDEEKKQELDETVDRNTQNNTTANNDIEVSSRLQSIKRNKRVGSNNSIQEMVTVLKESATLRKRKFEEKRTKTAVAEMDETDMFFMSMAKMTKKLPPIEQAKIKLQLSNAVLNAQINLNESESTRCSSRYSETPSTSTIYSAFSPEESSSIQEDETNRPILFQLTNCELEQIDDLYTS